ncbi:MAG TPA: hypothetical protein VG939_06330 [Caulobacteraceae bacterium]|nr:hypothetical protein [Caulobacteraceae bacterium]
MSEFQYFAFRSLDRALSDEDRKALREISSRATIDTRQFVNTYDYGDFRGDPDRMIDRWFDLFLYFADWGARRICVKLPRWAVAGDDLAGLEALEEAGGVVTVREADGVVIADCWLDNDAGGDWSDEEDLDAAVNALEALRQGALEGDRGLFQLMWLIAAEWCEDTVPEPWPVASRLGKEIGILAGIFDVDPDLAAVGAPPPAEPGAAWTPDDVRAAIARLPEDERLDLLMRAFEGDQTIGGELRRRLRPPMERLAARPRTVADLHALADARREAREQAEAARRAAERRRRISVTAARGDRNWDDLEALIAERKPAGYDEAVERLTHLRELAADNGTEPEFRTQLKALQERHRTKPALMERLAKAKLL